MTGTAARKFVEDELAAVSMGLYEGVTTGIAGAQRSLSQLDQKEHRALYSMTSRAFMRKYWMDFSVGPGWSVGGNVAQMGQTILISPGGGLALRLLKENGRIHPGGVPPAGTTSRRRQTWRQPALNDYQLPLPGVFVPLGSKLTLGSTSLTGERIECLLLWDIDWGIADAVISVRVVHTRDAGHYGSRVPVDMSYVVDPSGGMFDELRFRGASEEVDLYPNISLKENEGDASG